MRFLYTYLGEASWEMSQASLGEEARRNCQPPGPGVRKTEVCTQLCQKPDLPVSPLTPPGP